MTRRPRGGRKMKRAMFHIESECFQSIWTLFHGHLRQYHLGWFCAPSTTSASPFSPSVQISIIIHFISAWIAIFMTETQRMSHPQSLMMLEVVGNSRRNRWTTGIVSTSNRTSALSSRILGTAMAGKYVGDRRDKAWALRRL